ncbi:hypothetical protein SAMN05421780_102315 [Flexibacter flexilis DSM 6793]|uniref:DoxX-like family protein n=1 Tax=Flexibacter flexilis DSM 6793 TaxID=927664 RepID=A0A1I1FYD7_9BACT|nr:hypothetical protein [Flexibacter flexilis]SFC02618.1 hypothetical protein SAMN05421780_102315 [Flexibacter flexilis DSM 6793]
MKINKRILNIGLLVTSLTGYLEWGGGNQTFLWQAEWNVLLQFFFNPEQAAHPFTLIPMLGQILLIISLFSPKYFRLLTVSGIVCISLLLYFMFAISLLGMNTKILLSTLPYVVLSIWALLLQRRA